MAKRSRIKRETAESKALKKLRIKSGFSQRELALHLGVPQTKVSHTENGRAYIRKEYIELFLIGLGINWESWDDLVGVRDSENEIREECKILIERVSDDKLRLLYGLLISF